MIPYQPIRFNVNLVPEYDALEVETFGLPDCYGVSEYFVIASNEKELVNGEWRPEENFECRGRIRKKPRPTHRYSREERFETILRNLMGIGKVPEEVIGIVADELVDYGTAVWEDTERVLRENGMTGYVNRIPVILSQLGFGKLIVGKVPVGDVELAFREMSERFKRVGGRRYFPKMRYVCVRLLMDHGAKFTYRIPLVKTDCKIIPLDNIYNKLRDFYLTYTNKR